MKNRILTLLKESSGFVSGQELSDRFGVSRTSIWKAIRQLEEAGYEIEAVRNRGYRLVSEPDLLDEAHIRPHLHTNWAGTAIRVYDTIDSTNNEAKRLAESGAQHGLLVIGEEQTAGRGRRGRAWASQKGDGIFLSLLLKPDIRPASASMLTLVMGMAVREALEELTGLDVQIKWPNDIICGGRKLCGILTEMSAEMDCIHYIVIGIGINIHNSDFPEEMKQIATSLRMQGTDPVSRSLLTARILECFEDYFEQYLETQDLKNLIDEYNAHLINSGRDVRIIDQKQNEAGTALGINEKGELLVRTQTGLKCVSAGEVSVRGVYGYV